MPSFYSPEARRKGEGTGAFDVRYPVVRKGLRRDCLLLVAPISIRAQVVAAGGSYVLEASCTQVFNVGDGIRMDVYLLERGHRRSVYSRYFDAGRQAGDRDWVPVAIPIEIGQPQDTQIEIEASAGPQGNLDADWLALSSVRLAWRGGSR